VSFTIPPACLHEEISPDLESDSRLSKREELDCDVDGAAGPGEAKFTGISVGADTRSVEAAAGGTEGDGAASYKTAQCTFHNEKSHYLTLILDIHNSSFDCAN